MMSRHALWLLALGLWAVTVAYALRSWEEGRPRPQLERAPLPPPCRVAAEDFRR